MKKIILLVAFGAAGLAGAKNLEVKEAKNQQIQQENEKAFFYLPVKVTSSCGYTEYIEMGGSSISCLEVEIDRMEEECDAPVDGWGYA
jgi:hypothetical protein